MEVSAKTKKAIESRGEEVDYFYCNEGYKSTGTGLIAGGYFG